MPETCQVDFYLLGSQAPSAEHLACRLALMAWERGHSIDIVTDGDAAAQALDQLMWQYPAGRFLPHDVSSADRPGQAPVRILATVTPQSADVVINLTTNPIKDPRRFRRLLEIVPHRDAERAASREKFRAYRELGLEPGTHDIN